MGKRITISNEDEYYNYTMDSNVLIEIDNNVLIPNNRIVVLLHNENDVSYDITFPSNIIWEDQKELVKIDRALIRTTIKIELWEIPGSTDWLASFVTYKK